MEEHWDQRIAELKRYEKEYGTVNVSGSHRDRKDEWSSLARFVYFVRNNSRLSEERHAQLAAMGFTFAGSKEEKEQQQWEEMFNRLIEYKKVHGNCLVHAQWKEEPQLGRWVSDVRAKKKRGLLRAEVAT